MLASSSQQYLNRMANTSLPSPNLPSDLSRVAVGWDAEDVEKLKNRFEHLDKKNKGYLTPKDLESLPELAANPLAHRIVDVLFKIHHNEYSPSSSPSLPPQPDSIVNDSNLPGINPASSLNEGLKKRPSTLTPLPASTMSAVTDTSSTFPITQSSSSTLASSVHKPPHTHHHHHDRHQQEQRISFDEFLSFLLPFSPTIPSLASNSTSSSGSGSGGGNTRETKLRFAFNIYDVDGDGFISRTDLYHILKCLTGSSSSSNTATAGPTSSPTKLATTPPSNNVPSSYAKQSQSFKKKKEETCSGFSELQLAKLVRDTIKEWDVIDNDGFISFLEFKRGILLMSARSRQHNIATQQQSNPTTDIKRAEEEEIVIYHDQTIETKGGEDEMGESTDESDEEEFKLPRSRSELRNMIKPMLTPFWLFMLILFLAIVVSGAIFFLVLVGWVIPSGEGGNTKQNYYEITSQILNGIFTLLALMTQPVRSLLVLWTYRWYTSPISSPRRREYARLIREVIPDICLYAPDILRRRKRRSTKRARPLRDKRKKDGTVVPINSINDEIKASTTTTATTSTTANTITSNTTTTNASKSANKKKNTPAKNNNNNNPISNNSGKKKGGDIKETEITKQEVYPNMQELKIEMEEATPFEAPKKEEATTESIPVISLQDPPAQKENPFNQANLIAGPLPQSENPYIPTPTWKWFLLLALLNGQNLFQIPITFGMWYFSGPSAYLRPPWIVFTFLPLSFLCGSASGIWPSLLTRSRKAWDEENSKRGTTTQQPSQSTGDRSQGIDSIHVSVTDKGT